jgi:carboxynorspermidine decarboxylase
MKRQMMDLFNRDLPVPSVPAITPYFLFHGQTMADAIASYRAAFPLSAPAIFYSLKANSIAAVIESVADLVDGFSASSLFEARLAKEIAPGKPVHFVSPCLRADEVSELASLCDTICCNTLGHFELASRAWREPHRVGLRIDPLLSFVADERYDPCRPNSKLGVPLNEVAGLPVTVQLGGVCFHSNSESEQFGDLLNTTQGVVQSWPWEAHPLRWMNLGGGYLADSTDAAQLDSYLLALKDKHNIEKIILEPGFGVVNAAGTLTATITDVFSKHGKTIAILDTTINHLPEVLEFGYSPKLAPRHEGKLPCLLAGASCLAGDLFGEYQLATMPRLGDRITFINVGAYSIVKANAFNGINLPDVYVVGNDGDCRRCPGVGYDEYKKIWGRV